MPTALARDAELLHVSSHSVNSDFRGGEVQKEELYPRYRAVWRGQDVVVEMEASCYRFSDGDWSDWRIFAGRAYFLNPDNEWGGNPTTDTARKALGELCRPLVVEWLGSDAYAESRQRAFASLIRQELRDVNGSYSIEPVAATLKRYRNELSPADRDRFGLVLEYLKRLWEILDTTKGD